MKLDYSRLNKRNIKNTYQTSYVFNPPADSDEPEFVIELGTLPLRIIACIDAAVSNLVGHYGWERVVMTREMRAEIISAYCVETIFSGIKPTYDIRMMQQFIPDSFWQEGWSFELKVDRFGLS